MAFSTNAAIVNDEYGINEYDSNSKSYKFKPLGQAVFIESITRDIETNAVRLSLRWTYQGETIRHELPRKAISDPSLLQELAEVGADVTKKHFNTFVDTLRLQEVDIASTGVGCNKVYTHLGWKTIPTVDMYGMPVNALCYRAATMVGAVQANYVGSLKVKPMGAFEIWRNMVNEEILGHIPAEVVLLSGLSALVNGLISTSTTGENPIVHLNGLSGTGKSAIAMAACSAYGEPFDGERKVFAPNGVSVSQSSVYGSWCATKNATLGRCAGNRGCIIILNELGKMKEADMSDIVYNLSEGTDKARLSKDLAIHQMEGYTTTILSIGEHSLLDRCQSKADGLRVRVLELDMAMTTSAENADRIKAISRKNNGWAAPMLAEYILRNGGIKMVLNIYDRWRGKLLSLWPDTPFRERFVSKFPALFLTTAELAKAALGIAFHEDEIIDFFLNYEQQQGRSRSSTADSYDIILSQCRVNAHKFIRRGDKSVAGHNTAINASVFTPAQDCWGRITRMEREHDDGRLIVEEFEIRKNVLEKLLREHNFQNIKTCLAAWKESGVLNFEDATHPCRARKLDGAAEDVYVLRVFASEQEAAEIRARREAEEAKRLKRLKKSPQILSITRESEETESA